MLILQCDITIKSKHTDKIVKFDYVNSIEVKTSCKNLTDTAVVKIPRKMRWHGKSILDYIRRDDEITISAGYKNYGVKTLFKGYINSVENSTPIVINCENEMRRLKTITVEAERIEKFNIKDFIKRYAPDIEVECPDSIDFGEVIVEEQTLAQFLDGLMKKFTWFKGFFRDGKLVSVFDMNKLQKPTVHAFSPDRNMISDSLKYTLKEDVKIAIKATSILKDNSKLEVTVPKEAENGKDYEQRQFYFPGYTDLAKLKEAAEKKLAEFVCDKMDGTITAFGIPYVVKGDTVKLNDKIRTERDGRKFKVDAVDYQFNNSGYRQTITLGYEIK